MSDVVPSDRFLLHVDGAGRPRIDVRFDGDTVWLTQAQLAELFDTSRENITQDIGNVIAERELDAAATCKESSQVAA